MNFFSRSSWGMWNCWQMKWKSLFIHYYQFYQDMAKGTFSRLIGLSDYTGRKILQAKQHEEAWVNYGWSNPEHVTEKFLLSAESVHFCFLQMLHVISSALLSPSNNCRFIRIPSLLVSNIKSLWSDLVNFYLLVSYLFVYFPSIVYTATKSFLIWWF